MQNDTPTVTSFEDIALEATIRPVTDDLDGIARKLHRSGDRVAAYAAFAGERFLISAAAGRALGFAQETERFLALAQTSPKPQVAACLDMLTALTVLNSASVIALAIMPPRTGEDALARNYIADSVASRLRESGDPAMIEAAALAFEIGPLPIAAGEDQRRTFVLAGAVPSSLKSARQGEPAMVALEQGLSLTAFMRDLPQVAALVERAALQLDDADRIAREIAEGDIGPEALDGLERARHGAALLATADLARACIYADLIEGGASAKDRALAVAPRLPEARLRSIVAFAAMTGGVIGELGSAARALTAAVRGH
ncbi:conserved hypothetical protein [Hyphomicrobiales bacterium]|nr:conserved hypothetical protein [Hyphomicrobiales bacterium]CAH1701473.1 conserved hypothetical protein [Hyphomicrobiales bacterium]CAI0345430.1 conserved hypothetical protein [Hyphomicrobiales bacterium]